MIEIIISFLAGVLTVLAPCVLPLLPIIIGGTLANTNKLRPFIITLSLALSVIIFTLILKVSTIFANIDQNFLNIFSGGLIFMLGIFILFPQIWEWISAKLKFGNASQNFLNSSAQKSGLFGSVLIGVSLGPVFASCSPTYGYIVSTVFRVNFFSGFIYLLFYALGLAIIMFLIAFFGQNLIKKLKWASNPYGIFHKILGIIFIIVGALILLGIDKKIEVSLLQNGYLDSVLQVENNLVENNFNK